MPRWSALTSISALAGRKQAGAPRPAPGATVTVRSSRPATGATCAVIWAEKASQAAEGRGREAGAGAGGVALMTALLSRQRGAGLDLAAEGERGDGLAEGLGEGGGDHVAVLGRGDPSQVGERVV